MDKDPAYVLVEEVPWSMGKHTSWDRVHDAAEYLVTFGLAHRVPGAIRAIGVDEIQRGKGHKYLTLVYQIDLGCHEAYIVHLLIGSDISHPDDTFGESALTALATGYIFERRRHMKKRSIPYWSFHLCLVVTVMISAVPGNARAQNDNGQGNNNDQDNNRNAPVSAVKAIPVQGNPITSADISWADPGTERYYFADRSNAGVDIIDAEKDVWIGRVGGMAGALPSGGGTSTTNGSGPNGVVVTPSKHLWAGDGNSTAQLADVDPNSPTYLHILHSVSTAVSVCDGGTSTTHFCGRADELDYDPVHHIILIANNAPLSLSTPRVSVDPYATFINADPPYNVLGHITFVGAGGLEQPRWDDQTQRFLITVPGKMVGTTIVTQASIQVINPTTMKSEKSYPIDCHAVAGVTSVDATGIVLRPDQHILVSACGFPVILTLDEKTTQIHVINVIKQVGGGDEIWFNPGDGRFYVTGLDMTIPTGVQSLGVINAETSEWLQNVSDVRGKNPAALPENNHIFTIVQITSAIAGGTAADDSICATKFNIKGTGCIAVFEHSQ